MAHNDTVISSDDIQEEIQAVFESLREGGINTPPIDPEMAPRLRPEGEMTFSTRDLPASLYQVGFYMEEFLGGRVNEDYVAIGIDGYGMFSVYFHYFMVRGKFGLFLQLPVQSGTDETGTAIAAINSRLQSIEELLTSPPVGPMAIMEIIDFKAIMTGPSLDRLTATRTRNPLATFVSQRAKQDSEAVILNV